MSHLPGTGVRPCEVHDNLRDIDFEALAAQGLVYYVIDVDNTLAMLNSDELNQEVVKRFAALRAQGVIQDICLVSNTVVGSRHREQRVALMAEHLNAHYICATGFRSKPHALPFQSAMQTMQATPETTVVIGDQLYTDIRGGNALGIYTIWVKPLGADAWFTMARRLREKWQVRRWR